MWCNKMIKVHNKYINKINIAERKYISNKCNKKKSLKEYKNK